MKKTFLYCTLLCAAMLLVFAQAGFAWENTNLGCLAEGCHVAAFGAPNSLHSVPAHNTCTNCHAGAAGPGNVFSSACLECHAGGDVCTLIETPHGNPTSCLECHTTCAPAPTTTTTVPTETTTTVPAETTTTVPTSTTSSIPGGCSITIDPDEVTVNGILNQTLTVTATVETGVDLTDVTEEDLELLGLEVNDDCLEYITVNSSTINSIDETTITASAEITVDGKAPSTECMISVSDPEGIFDPPLNCSATFSIISSAEACRIVSISPAQTRVGLGLLPRVRTVTLTLNVDIEELGITGADLSFQEPRGITILGEPEVSGNTISARVLFWGVQPGSYIISLGPCGTAQLQIVRF